MAHSLDVLRNSYPSLEVNCLGGNLSFLGQFSLRKLQLLKSIFLDIFELIEERTETAHSLGKLS